MLYLVFIIQNIITVALGAYLHDAAKKRGRGYSAVTISLFGTTLFWFILQMVAANIVHNERPDDNESNNWATFYDMVISGTLFIVLVVRHFVYLRGVRPTEPTIAPADINPEIINPADTRRSLAVIGPVVLGIAFVVGWMLYFANQGA